MMRVTGTELVWPGKYKEAGTLKEVPRVSLPFQVIETVNESRATRNEHQVSSIQYPETSIKYPVSSIQNLASSIQHPISIDL